MPYIEFIEFGLWGSEGRSYWLQNLVLPSGNAGAKPAAFRIQWMCVFFSTVPPPSFAFFRAAAWTSEMVAPLEVADARPNAGRATWFGIETCEGCARARTCED